MLALLAGATKAGVHTDRKKEEARQGCRDFDPTDLDEEMATDDDLSDESHDLDD